MTVVFFVYCIGLKLLHQILHQQRTIRLQRGVFQPHDLLYYGTALESSFRFVVIDPAFLGQGGQARVQILVTEQGVE